MYYPSLFSALRQYEVPVVTSGCRGERGEIPLDLSNKNNVRQAADHSTGSDTEAELLMLEHRKLAAGLSSQSLQGMARHLPPSSVSSFFDPALFRLPAFRTDANGLCGHSTPTMMPPLGGTPPFCLDRVPVSNVTTPSYGTHALTTLLQQRERCLDQANSLCAANARNPSQPIFFDPLPLHLRSNGQRERSLFAPTLAAPLGLPGYPLYPDLLSDVGRTEKGAFTSLRAPSAADKAFYLNGGLEAARFAEHLQRLREQHVHQAKCSGTCCSTVACGCCIQGSSQSPLCAARGGVGCLANKDPSTGKMCNTTCDLLTPGLSLLGARPNPTDLRFINPYCHTLGDGLQRDDAVTGLFQPSPLWGALPTMPLAKGPVPLTTNSPFTAPKKKETVPTQKENSKLICKEPTEKDKEGAAPSERREEKVRCQPITSTYKSEHDVIIIEENARNESVIKELNTKDSSRRLKPSEDAPPTKMPRLEAVISETSVNNNVIPKSTTPLSPPPLIAVSSSGPTVTTSHLPITPTALIAQPQYHNVYSAQHLVNKMSLVASVNSPKLADPLPHYYADKTMEDVKPELLPFDITQVVRHYENSDAAMKISRTVLQNLLTDSIKQEYRHPAVDRRSPNNTSLNQGHSPKNELINETENTDISRHTVEPPVMPAAEIQATVLTHRTTSLHHQPGNVSTATKLAKSLRQKSRRVLGLRTDFRAATTYKLLSKKYKHFGYGERTRRNRRFAIFRTRWTLRKQFLSRLCRPATEGDVQEGKKDLESRSLPNLGMPWREKLVYSCHGAKRRRMRTGLDMVTRKKRKSRPSTKTSIRSAESQWQKERNFSKVTSDPLTSMPPEMKRLIVNKALGETILHRAARLGYTDVVAYCLDSNYCDINARDNAGYTPLHECCARGHLEIGRALLQYGADVNASAAGGIRPLHDAIENGHVELVRLVLSYGADPTLATYSGLTPLKLARSALMAELLQGFLADVNGEANGRPLLPWRFHGSASCLDRDGIGFDIFEDIPSDTDSDVEENTDFLFEVSATPHLPAYRLQLPATLIKPRCNWLKLNDVLRQTSLKRKEFRKLYSHIDIVAVSHHYFQTNAVCSQLLNGKTNNATEDRVEHSDSMIELVKLDNNIRDILGIETIILR